MIPVFEPVIGDEEIEAVVAALRRGEISGTFGKCFDPVRAAIRQLFRMQIRCRSLQRQHRVAARRSGGRHRGRRRSACERKHEYCDGSGGHS